MDRNNAASVRRIISTTCVWFACAVCFWKLSTTQPNTTQNTLPMNKSARETGGMVLVCAERWISELGSLNGAGLGEEYWSWASLSWFWGGCAWACACVLFSVFLHKAVVFSPEIKPQPSILHVWACRYISHCWIRCSAKEKANKYN